MIIIIQAGCWRTNHVTHCSTTLLTSATININVRILIIYIMAKQQASCLIYACTQPAPRGMSHRFIQDNFSEENFAHDRGMSVGMYTGGIVQGWSSGSSCRGTSLYEHRLWFVQPGLTHRQTDIFWLVTSVVTVNRTDIDTAVFCCHRGVVVLAMF